MHSSAFSAPSALNIPRFASRTRRRQTGFTFIEVLFATILLGLGFIMIAAVFPAALDESLTTSDETAGTLVCQDALRQIQNIANDTNLPYPGTGYGSPASLFSPMVPLGNWNFNYTQNSVSFTISANPLAALGGNQFFSTDHRYAWVAFYRRISPTDPMAQVVVVAMKSNLFANSNYNIPPPVPPLTGYLGNPTNTPNTVKIQETSLPYNTATTSNPNIPFPITANLLYSQAANTSYILLPDATQYTANLTLAYSTVSLVGAVPYAPGAYVVVADDNANTTNQYRPEPAGSLIGRVLRLGPSVPFLASGFPSDIWIRIQNLTNVVAYQLQPGMDLVSGPGSVPAAPFSREETWDSHLQTVFTLPVYVIGQVPSYNNIDQAYDGPYTGGNQAIAAMTGYVKINN